MKVGILTSGGDAPGMNAFISKFTTLATAAGFEVIAFKFGYQGLIDNSTKPLTREDVSNIAHLGGSNIKSTRSSEFLTRQGFKRAIQNIKLNEIDCLVVLGGDGTLRGAKELSVAGIKVIYIPATIDNDLSYTDQTLGFDSAVNAAVDAIDKIKQTMLSLNRIFICEVMGRHCPDIAISSAIATDATILITEAKNFSFKETISKIKEAIESGEEAPSIVIRENILDVFELAKKIQNELDIETRACRIGYVQRGTSPSVMDRILARKFAQAVLDLISSKKFNRAVGQVKNKIITKNLTEI